MASQALQVRFIGMEPPVSDEDAERLARLIAEEVRRRHGAMRLPTSGTLVELRVELQSNAVGDRGCVALANALKSLRDIASEPRVSTNSLSRLPYFLASQRRAETGAREDGTPARVWCVKRVDSRYVFRKRSQAWVRDFRLYANKVGGSAQSQYRMRILVDV